MRHVIATAGHVDHGKSALVRALTGMEPDRWQEERRRGLTIDLGFAWTPLPSGREVSFVDVPGHERFLANMLAGLGPAPVVCFLVAVDQGWQAQSSEHRDAIAALGIDVGLLVLTRADLAPDRESTVLAEARAELAATGLAQAPAVTTSAADGTGLAELRAALDVVLAETGPPETGAPVRMWVDRSFAAPGAGTVVTGTLGAGTLHRDDRLEVHGVNYSGPATIRGLQSHRDSRDLIEPVSRAAVNLRSLDIDEIRRGDALLTPGAWQQTSAVDVRGVTGLPLRDVPAAVDVHVGTAAVRAHCRPFDTRHARLTFHRGLPLVVGDRLVLRGTGSRLVLGGVQVLDVDPPRITRRGDGARRSRTLEGMSAVGDLRPEILRREAAQGSRLERMGITVPEVLPGSVRRFEDWLVDQGALDRWCGLLHSAVKDDAAADPLSPGLSEGAAVDLLDLPDPALLTAVLESSGLRRSGGRLLGDEAGSGLGAAEEGVAEVERRLAMRPFHAPESAALQDLGLGARELAAAERHGRLLRLSGGVVLLPRSPALAMRVLAELDEPFTASDARQALGTTRRCAIPLLEHLDAQGWTRRLDSGAREVLRRDRGTGQLGGDVDAGGDV